MDFEYFVKSCIVFVDISENMSFSGLKNKLRNWKCLDKLVNQHRKP